MEAKTIRNCYFDIDESSFVSMKNVNLPAKPMKFNCWDKLATFKRDILKFICPWIKSKHLFGFFSNSQLTYIRAYDEYRKELNLF